MRHVPVFVLAFTLFTTLTHAQQFSDKDRQATSTWYAQHQAKPPVGFREQDRLSPDQESRLQVGQKMDGELISKRHPVPVTLRRQLPAPGPGYQYSAVGGHVVVAEKKTNVVHDVIHVLDKATR